MSRMCAEDHPREGKDEWQGLTGSSWGWAKEVLGANEQQTQFWDPKWRSLLGQNLLVPELNGEVGHLGSQEDMRGRGTLACNPSSCQAVLKASKVGMIGPGGTKMTWRGTGFGRQGRRDGLAAASCQPPGLSLLPHLQALPSPSRWLGCSLRVLARLVFSPWKFPLQLTLAL